MGSWRFCLWDIFHLYTVPSFRIVNFWKNLAVDYREATLDIVKWGRAKPLKAGALGSLASFGLYANATNPNELAFTDCMVRVNEDLCVVPASARNPASAAWLTDIGRASIQGQLRAWNCGLFTVMWRSDYSPELGHIKANCKYLVPGYLDVFTEGRIVDVGFLGKWWLTDKAMTDYDVNPDEWDEHGRPRQSQLKQMW